MPSKNESIWGISGVDAATAAVPIRENIIFMMVGI
jgi:hypothetical protein